MKSILPICLHETDAQKGKPTYVVYVVQGLNYWMVTKQFNLRIHKCRMNIFH
jgi:hypothetical protein